MMERWDRQRPIHGSIFRNGTRFYAASTRFRWHALQAFAIVFLLVPLSACSTNEIQRRDTSSLDDCFTGNGTRDGQIACCKSCVYALSVVADDKHAYEQTAVFARLAAQASGILLGLVFLLPQYRRWSAKPRKPRDQVDRSNKRLRFLRAPVFVGGWCLLCVALPVVFGFGAEVALSHTSLASFRGAAETIRSMHADNLHTHQEGAESTSLTCSATLNIALDDVNSCSDQVASWPGFNEGYGPISPNEVSYGEWSAGVSSRIEDMQDLLTLGGRPLSREELEQALPESEEGIYEKMPAFRTAARSRLGPIGGAWPPLLWGIASVLLLVSSLLVQRARSKRLLQSTHDRVVKKNVAPGLVGGMS